MHPSCDSLVSALQAELQEYGALLHLFELQQNHLLRHDSEGFLNANHRVDSQLEIVTRTRTLRESLVKSVAADQRFPESATLSDLIESFPLSRRPLLRALMEEINNLLTSVRRRAHQNRMLLAQCVESARDLITSLQPNPAPRTYSPRGQIYSGLCSGEQLPAVIA